MGTNLTAPGRPRRAAYGAAYGGAYDPAYGGAYDPAYDRRTARRQRGMAPRRARSIASAAQTFANSPRCSDSFAPWARVSGSSTPVTMIDASGKRAEKSEMNGIE